MTRPAEDGRTDHFEDEEIRAVVEHYDDPEHPDALDVGDVRELLAEVQAVVEARWDDRLEDVGNRDLEAVGDLGDVVVLRDAERTRWDRLLDAVECYDQVARTVTRVTHHQAAERLLDRAFEGADPIVVRKPEAGDAGQRFVEAVVNGLRREGVPATEAWAYYGVVVRGRSVDEWAARCGEDRVRVADAAETARDRLGE